MDESRRRFMDRCRRGRAGHARLAQKIRNGGQGVWGQVPMPPNPSLGEAELKTIVGWVLQQK